MQQKESPPVKKRTNISCIHSLETKDLNCHKIIQFKQDIFTYIRHSWAHDFNKYIFSLISHTRIKINPAYKFDYPSLGIQIVMKG